MGTVNEVRDAAKLLLDAAKALQHERETKRGPLFEPYQLASVYELLGELDRHIMALRNTHRLAPLTAEDAWRQFVGTLDRLCEAFSEINLTALEMYAPSVARQLGKSYSWGDLAVYERYPRSRRGCLSLFTPLSFRGRRYEKLYNRFSKTVGSLFNTPCPDITAFEEGRVYEALTEVAHGVTECRKLVAEFMRENWQPSDLSR